MEVDEEREGIDCSVRPIPYSWLGLPAPANHVFYPSGEGELVPDLSGKDNAPTYSSAHQPKSLCRSSTHSDYLHSEI